MPAKVFTEEKVFDMIEFKVKFPEGEIAWFESYVKNFCNGILESIVIINHFDDNNLYEIPASWIKAAR